MKFNNLSNKEIIKFLIDKNSFHEATNDNLDEFKNRNYYINDYFVLRLNQNSKYRLTFTVSKNHIENFRVAEFIENTFIRWDSELLKDFADKNIKNNKGFILKYSAICDLVRYMEKISELGLFE